MRRTFIAAAALGLALSAMGPASARAGREAYRHDDHRHDAPPARVERDEYRSRDDYRGREGYHDRGPAPEYGRDDHAPYHGDEFKEYVSLRRVPCEVLETAERLGNGRRVEWVRFVRSGGRTYYVVRMNFRGRDDINVRVYPNGRLLDVERPECP